MLNSRPRNKSTSYWFCKHTTVSSYVQLDQAIHFQLSEHSQQLGEGGGGAAENLASQLDRTIFKLKACKYTPEKRPALLLYRGRRCLKDKEFNRTLVRTAGTASQVTSSRHRRWNGLISSRTPSPNSLTFTNDRGNWTSLPLTSVIVNQTTPRSLITGQAIKSQSQTDQSHSRVIHN